MLLNVQILQHKNLTLCHIKISMTRIRKKLYKLDKTFILGASCKDLNNVKIQQMFITSDFEVKYGEIPYWTTEVYTPPKNDSMKGVYDKTVINLVQQLVQIQLLYLM